MADKLDLPKSYFHLNSSSMNDQEVAAYCDSMGWTDDPVVRVLVERLFAIGDFRDEAHEDGWNSCISAILEIAESAQTDVEECSHCEAVNDFNQLISDIGNEAWPGPNAADNASDLERGAPAKRRPSKRVSKKKPGPSGEYLQAIVSVFTESSPMTGPDIFEAVKVKMGSHALKNSTSTALSKAVSDGFVIKLPGRLYALPVSSKASWFPEFTSY